MVLIHTLFNYLIRREKINIGSQVSFNDIHILKIFAIFDYFNVFYNLKVTNKYYKSLHDYIYIAYVNRGLEIDKLLTNNKNLHYFFLTGNSLDIQIPPNNMEIEIIDREKYKDAITISVQNITLDPRPLNPNSPIYKLRQLRMLSLLSFDNIPELLKSYTVKYKPGRADSTGNLLGGGEESIKSKITIYSHFNKFYIIFENIPELTDITKLKIDESLTLHIAKRQTTQTSLKTFDNKLVLKIKDTLQYLCFEFIDENRSNFIALFKHCRQHNKNIGSPPNR